MKNYRTDARRQNAGTDRVLPLSPPPAGLGAFIDAVIVPALVDRWLQEQGSQSQALDTARDQKTVAVWDTSALP